MQKNTNIARTLRKNATKQERILWKFLRNSSLKGYKFRRQYPIGNYIVDFVCLEKFLIIEIDGGQHNVEEIIRYDKERTDYLNQRGFKILRYWNNDIDKNLLGVYKNIMENI